MLRIIWRGLAACLAGRLDKEMTSGGPTQAEFFWERVCDMAERRFCCSWMEGNWRGVGFLTPNCPGCGAGIVWPVFVQK